MHAVSALLQRHCYQSVWSWNLSGNWWRDTVTGCGTPSLVLPIPSYFTLVCCISIRYDLLPAACPEKKKCIKILARWTPLPVSNRNILSVPLHLPASHQRILFPHPHHHVFFFINSYWMVLWKQKTEVCRAANTVPLIWCQEPVWLRLQTSETRGLLYSFFFQIKCQNYWVLKSHQAVIAAFVFLV